MEESIEKNIMTQENIKITLYTWDSEMLYSFGPQNKVHSLMANPCRIRIRDVYTLLNSVTCMFHILTTYVGLLTKISNFVFTFK